MKTDEFIELLIERLEIEDEEVNIDTDLSSLKSFDSMAVMIVVALADELFDTRLSSDQLSKVTTVRSLMELIGNDKFE